MTKAMDIYNSYLDKTALNMAKDKQQWTGNIPETAKINAWNELQNNMVSNRNFNKDSKETSFAYEFKKNAYKRI